MECVAVVMLCGVLDIAAVLLRDVVCVVTGLLRNVVGVVTGCCASWEYRRFLCQSGI